jgi:hypothetical protein
MVVFYVGGSFGIESIGTLHKQSRTCQLVPSVPLAQKFTGALIEDEVEHSLIVAGGTDGGQHGLILWRELSVTLGLEVRCFGGRLNTGGKVIGVLMEHGVAVSISIC